MRSKPDYVEFVVVVVNVVVVVLIVLAVHKGLVVVVPYPLLDLAMNLP